MGCGVSKSGSPMPSEMTPSVLATSSKKSRMPERRRPATCRAMKRVVSRGILEEVLIGIAVIEVKSMGAGLEPFANGRAHLGCAQRCLGAQIGRVLPFLQGEADRRFDFGRLFLEAQRVEPQQ